MKRFFSYQREDGEVYEICADVMKSNQKYFIAVFNELPLQEVMSFVTGNKSVVFHNVLDIVEVLIPIEMVKYIGNEIPNAEDTIRCCGRVDKNKE